MLTALPVGERELVIRRTFDAPRDLIFRAWTEAEHVRRWWGPRNYPAAHMEMDARPGGRWRGYLKSTEGKPDLWFNGVFREVDPPGRVVFTFAWEEEGERGMETEVTVLLTEQGGRTHMEFRQTPFRSIAERDGHHGGWDSAFDRLDERLAAISDRQGGSDRNASR